MKFSSVTAAGAAFGLAAATPITSKRSSNLSKRQVPQEQSHGFVLSITNEFMKLDNTLNIQDAVFGLLGNAAAEEGAGDVTNLDCLKQESADQAFTNAKAAGDIRGMAGALLFQAIERNTGKVGLKSVLCDQPAANAEIGALSSHQDAASEDAPELNKAITLELARQLASIGADPNLALLSGTFAPGDPNDNTGAGNSCDDEDLKLGCIYTEKLLVLDATEDEIASAVADVEQTFTGTGGIFATDLVNLADFEVAEVTGEPFDLAAVTPGSSGAGADSNAGAGTVATPGATPAVTLSQDECIITTTASPVAQTTGENCSVVTVTVGADQTKAIMAQYPSASAVEGEAAGEGTANDNQGNNDEGNANNNNQNDSNNNNQNDSNKNDQGNAEDKNDNSDNNNGQGDAAGNQNGNDGAASAENLQAFDGALGGAAPPVVNNGSGDRPFEVNGATFTDEATARIRSCDIQNNQCFNAINGGQVEGDTAQCTAQLDACRAAASGGAARKMKMARRNNLILSGNSNLAGNVGSLVGASKGLNVGSLLGGAGGSGLNLGNLLGGGNLAALLGGLDGGAAKIGGAGAGAGAGAAAGAMIPPSKGSQKLVTMEIVQCS